MSTESIWFYEREGERQGPVAAGEILDLFAKGDLGPGNLVWREGLTDWIPFSASELAAAAALRPTPPAMPAALSVGPPPVPRSAEPFVPREARLRPGFRPAIRASYGRAWELMTTRFWPLVGSYTLMTLILGVAGQLYIPAFFLIFPLMGGLFWYILRCIRGQEVNLEMLFEGFRRQFGPLAIANLIVAGIATAVTLAYLALIGVLIFVLAENSTMFNSMEDDPVAIALFVGLCLVALFVLMIPLILLGVVSNFATLLILDCNLRAGEALSLGWRATRPHLMKFILFMFVNAALSLVGLIALYVGMFITCTWATIALVYVYEDAFGDEPGPA